MLGYYPTDSKKDGKWHPIKVDVKRSGIKVRVRDAAGQPTSKDATRGGHYRAIESRWQHWWLCRRCAHEFLEDTHVEDVMDPGTRRKL